LQGVPVGNNYYNNYAIVTSEHNLDFTGNDDLVFINETNNDKHYHKIDCPVLSENSSDTIIGFKSTDMLVKKIDYSQKLNDGSSMTMPYYFYEREETACYYCMIESNYTHTSRNN
jgi:hypothetical protein